MSPSISERAEPCCCDTTTPSSLSIFVLLVVTVSALTVAIGAGTVMLPTTIAAASTIVNNFLFFIKNTPLCFFPHLCRYLYCSTSPPVGVKRFEEGFFTSANQYRR